MGFASIDAAVAMATRYAEILGGTLEMDIRPVDIMALFEVGR